MAVWHGEKNISHDAGRIVSKFDHATRKYVVDVEGKAADEFKKIADFYGYTPADESAPAPEK